MTGFIVVDKPKDITSFKAAAIVRRITGEKKTGHTGTLDPMATGVLPMALGRASRFIELLPDHNKAYDAGFVLGKTTDTLDITGKLLSETDIVPEKEQVIETINSFKGDISQIPPMYSALKVDGRRLYDLARQGIEVERKSRNVTVFSIDNITFENNEYRFSVKCSEGTYIRTLVSDIGEALGCGAVMTYLRRTLSNGFSGDNSHSIEELENASQKELKSFLISVESVFSRYESVKVTSAQATRFLNGGELDADRLHYDFKEKYYRVYSPENVFLGIGEYDGNTSPDMKASLKVKRVYFE